VSELPEVETIRRELEREVVGKKVKSVEVTNNRSIRRHTNRKQFAGRLEGTKVMGVTRRGNYLVLRLDSSDILVVQLGPSGQLLRAAAREPVDKNTEVVITFTQGGQLRFADPRPSGEMFVTTPDELTTEVPELAELGIDPVEEPISWTQFGRLLHSHPMRLKAFLTDQKLLAGIGNIYSDEILFAAGLRYDRMSNELSSQEIRRLYRAVVETLHDAIKYGGSTLADGQYLNLAGQPGEYQEYHQVYDREKQACRRCRATIVKAKFAGRTTYFCEHCQV
jgi:formamidopyrimidine-DNA glycosylase